MELFEKMLECVDFCKDINNISGGEILEHITQEEFDKMEKFLRLSEKQIKDFLDN